MAAARRPSGPRSKRIRGGWVLEAAAIVLLLYPLYGWARDLVDAPRSRALRNAEQIIDWQQRFGINHERTIQEWFLPYRWFIGFWNLFYGSIHFVAPIVTLVALYHFDPARYVRWRNTFLWILVLALVGYWLYPLMPPRLLPSSFGFVDTRLTYFTIGKPVPHARETGILYAAMPSIHIAWATWAVFALWPLVRRPWARLLLASYPALIIFATVVTANHYFLDAVGAWGALALAYALASWRDWWPGRGARREPLSDDARRRVGTRPPASDTTRDPS
jgi:membrane-associated phospholipid phosphatase